MIEERCTRGITCWFNYFFFNNWCNTHALAALAYLARNAVEQKNYRVVGFMPAAEFAKVAAEATGAQARKP